MQLSGTCLIQRGSLSRSHRTVHSEFRPVSSAGAAKGELLPEHCHLQCPGQFSLEPSLTGVKRDWPHGAHGEEGSRGAQRPKVLSGERTCPPAPGRFGPAAALLHIPSWQASRVVRSNGCSSSVCLEAGAPGGHRETSLSGEALQGLTGG